MLLLMFLCALDKCVIALAQLTPDVCSLVPFPKKKQVGLGNYTIPSITDLFLEAGVQEICFLFADTLCFL